MLADEIGLPIYWEIELTGKARNFPFSMEFLDSRVSEEGILVISFLTN